MEADQGPAAPPDEPRADGATLPDSFSQLWSDVMGMLVSYQRGEGSPPILTQLAKEKKVTLLRWFSKIWSQEVCACKGRVKTSVGRV